jgi:cell division protein FtsN
MKASILSTVYSIRILFWVCSCIGFLAADNTAYSQASIVRNRLQLVAMGKIDDVKKELPDLLAEFPEDPGIQFLHASVLEDLNKSLPIYQKIVNGKPDCEWADDAQWRIVHYYTMKRDTNRARAELQNYRKNYPQSEFLLSAYDLIRATVGAGKFTVENPEPKSKITSQLSNSKSIPEKKGIDTSVITKSISKNSTSKTETSTKSSDGKSSKSDSISPSSKKLVVAEIVKSGKSETIFTLQVGVFKTSKAAETELADYTQKRLRCSILERKLADGSMRYVVAIGEYKSKKNAEDAIEIVKEQCNCSPLIIQKP